MAESFTPPPHASHHCRHYRYERGMNWSGPKCAAGIRLAGGDTDPSMPATDEELASTANCMPDADKAACPWREEWTDDERAAWAQWRAESQARAILIIEKIPGNSTDRKNKPSWGQTGDFPCPACEVGPVRWARARVNGHLHAACTTPGCFGIMQ